MFANNMNNKEIERQKARLLFLEKQRQQEREKEEKERQRLKMLKERQDRLMAELNKERQRLKYLESKMAEKARIDELRAKEAVNLKRRIEQDRAYELSKRANKMKMEWSYCK